MSNEAHPRAAVEVLLLAEPADLPGREEPGGALGTGRALTSVTRRADDSPTAMVRPLHSLLVLYSRIAG